MSIFCFSDEDPDHPHTPLRACDVIIPRVSTKEVMNRLTRLCEAKKLMTGPDLNNLSICMFIILADLLVRKRNIARRRQPKVHVTIELPTYSKSFVRTAQSELKRIKREFKHAKDTWADLTEGCVIYALALMDVAGIFPYYGISDSVETQSLINGNHLRLTR